MPDFLFNQMKSLYPDLTDEEAIAKIQAADQPTTQIEGPDTLITAPSPDYKQLAVDQVRQKYLGDKYNDAARQKVLDENAGPSVGTRISAALGALGQGLAGGNAASAGRQILDADEAKRKTNISNFEKGRSDQLDDLKTSEALSTLEAKRTASDPMAPQNQRLQAMLKNTEIGKRLGDNLSKMTVNDFPQLSKVIELENSNQMRKDAADTRNLLLRESLNQKAELAREKAASKDALSEGEKAVDKDYAKEYNKYTSNGRVNAINTIEKLDQLADEVAADTGFGEAGGGRLASLLPDALRSRLAIQRRDDARNFANKTLKELFGGQLSDAEREAAAREYWNDSLDNKSNAIRLKGKIKELRDAVAAQDAKALHFQQNRSLKNFNFTPIEKPEAPKNKPSWAK